MPITYGKVWFNRHTKREIRHGQIGLGIKTKVDQNSQTRVGIIV